MQGQFTAKAKKALTLAAKAAGRLHQSYPRLSNFNNTTSNTFQKEAA